MLSMYYFCLLPLEELRVQKNDLYLSKYDLLESLAEKCERSAKEVINTLLYAYVLSGCDTTSYV